MPISRSSRRNDHDTVKGAHQQDGALNPQLGGDGVQPLLAVELQILQGIEDVEPGHPEKDRNPEHHHLPADIAAQGDPGPHRRRPQADSQHDMGEGGKPLAEGVEGEEEKHQRREVEAKGVEHPGGDQQRGQRDDHEQPRLSARDLAGGDVAAGGAGVLGVDAGVDDAVQPHRPGARSDHRHADPEDLPQARRGSVFQRSQNHPHQGKGKGEDGVGELDHLQQCFGFVENGRDRHGTPRV